MAHRHHRERRGLGRATGIPGTIDSFKWVESRENYVFNGEDILSTDNAEGVTTLTLNY